MPTSSLPRYWLVRTNQESVNKNRLGIGWDEIPFSNFSSAEEVIKAIENKYGDNAVGRRKNQIRRFFEIKPSDYVICIVRGQSDIYLARRSDNGMIHDRTCGTDVANQIFCKFVKCPDGNLRKIPRSVLSEGLQRRLRVMGIFVNCLDSFGKEINNIFNDTVWDDCLGEELKKITTKMSDSLLQNIQNGKTNFSAGGKGMENLVRELLMTEGYEASIPAKNDRDAPDGLADVDIKAYKEDRFDTTQLLVQIKHHAGESDEKGIEQLVSYTQGRSEFEETILCFITSANDITNKARELAQKHDVKIICGKELVTWIFDQFHKLSHETQKQLGMIEVPYILR